MRIFDTVMKEPKPDTGKRTVVLHQASNFKIRVIELSAGGNIPPCEMAYSVIFYVLSGSADITVDGDTASVEEGQGIVSVPATISMASKSGTRLLGIQIHKSKVEEING